jgi:hypothetical protein
MKKLFTTLYGSSLYGTNTPESDRDVKHIVLPSLRDTLLGKVPKNSVKKTNKEENTKNSADDVDEEFIPIQVFAQDLMEGQTYALELAYAIEYTNAEQEIHEPLFLNFCRELRTGFMTSSMRPMVRYAINQANLYSNKGERLNAAEAVREFLKAYFFTHSEVQMHEVWDSIVIPGLAPIIAQYPSCVAITEYQITPAGEMRPCIKLLERILGSTASFRTNLGTVNSIIKKYGARARAAQEDQVDWKATSHALRIIEEAVTLLSGNRLVYPYPQDQVEKFLAIKRGEMDYKLVIGEIGRRMDYLTEVQVSSRFPEQTPILEKQLQDWLYEWLLIFYKLGDMK